MRAGIGALLAALLTSGVAAGQTEDADAARLRAGAALEGGGVFIPSVLNVGSVGVLGELHPINRSWAVYAVPSIDAITGNTSTRSPFNASGPASGVGLGGAVLVDYTLSDAISFGAGVDVDGVLSQGGSGWVNQSGLFVGGRLRVVYRTLVTGAGTRRRKGLALGIDMRLLDGRLGWTNEPPPGNSPAFGISPILWVGYSAF